MIWWVLFCFLSIVFDIEFVLLLCHLLLFVLFLLLFDFDLCFFVFFGSVVFCFLFVLCVCVCFCGFFVRILMTALDSRTRIRRMFWNMTTSF